MPHDQQVVDVFGAGTKQVRMPYVSLRTPLERQSGYLRAHEMQGRLRLQGGGCER
jgi:hypothetical protein